MTCGGLWSTACDASQQLTHLVLLEPARDIAFQFSHAASQHDDVFAGVVYLEPIVFALMASD